MDQNQTQFQAQYFQQPPVRKNAKYYRDKGWKALKGHFWIAMLAVLIATTLGASMLGSAGAMSFSPSFSISAPSIQDSEDTGSSSDSWSPTFGEDETEDTDISEDLTWMTVLIVIVAFSAAGLIFSVVFVMVMAVSVLIGGPITVGYQKFNLDLIDGKKPGIATIFSYFKHFQSTVKLKLRYTLLQLLACIPMFVVLPTVMIGISIAAILILGESVALGVVTVAIFALLIPLTFACTIPLYIFHYQYFFSFTLMAEYPDLSAKEAMEASANMMRGNKWRLFCLDLSFIGWNALFALAIVTTCGLASPLMYPLSAYMNASMTYFYDDISNRAAAKEAQFPSINPDDYDPDANAPADISQGMFMGNYELGDTAHTGMTAWKFPDEPVTEETDARAEATTDEPLRADVAPAEETVKTVPEQATDAEKEQKTENTDASATEEQDL